MHDDPTTKGVNMIQLLRELVDSETGAIGWMIVGILIGIVLVIWFLLSLIF